MPYVAIQTEAWKTLLKLEVCRAHVLLDRLLHFSRFERALLFSSQLHGLAQRICGANTSSSAVPVLDLRYGHVGNKSLSMSLRTAENGVHTKEFSYLDKWAS